MERDVEVQVLASIQCIVGQINVVWYGDLLYAGLLSHRDHLVVPDHRRVRIKIKTILILIITIVTIVTIATILAIGIIDTITAVVTHISCGLIFEL